MIQHNRYFFGIEYTIKSSFFKRLNCNWCRNIASHNQFDPCLNQLSCPYARKIRVLR